MTNQPEYWPPDDGPLVPVLASSERINIRNAALGHALYLCEPVSDATAEFSVPRVLDLADDFARWIETGAHPPERPRVDPKSLEVLRSQARLWTKLDGGNSPLAPAGRDVLRALGELP